MKDRPDTALPQSWSLVPLSDAGQVNPRAFDLEPADDDPVSFVPMAAVEAGSGKLDASTTRLWREVKKGYTRFQENDVLFAKITPCMENAKFALASKLIAGRGAGSTEFHVIRPMPGIQPRYILYFLLQESIRREARLCMKGAAGQLRVPPEFIERLHIPIPPATEQFRIVAEIEKQLTRLDAAVVAMESVHANLKRYRSSLISAACEGRLVPSEAELASREGRPYERAIKLLERSLVERRSTWASHRRAKSNFSREKLPLDTSKFTYQDPINPDLSDAPSLPDGWCWTSLDSLLREPLRNGHSAKSVDGGTGVPTFSLSAVTYGDFSASNIKMTSADPEKVGDLWVEPGDIFIERSNTPELVGTARMYSGPSRVAIFPDLLIRVRLLNTVLPRYVELVLQTRRIRNFFRGSAQGISGTMPKIDQSVVQEALIPLPPLAEQKAIVDAVEDQISVVDHVEEELEGHLKRGEALRQSIFRTAFEGKLVPQNSDDQPASVLLERIRSERGAKPTSARSNGQRKGVAIP